VRAWKANVYDLSEIKEKMRELEGIINGNDV